MENPPRTSKSQIKLYTDWQVWIGTAIGGPMAAAYFISRNFWKLGRSTAFWITWIVCFSIILLWTLLPFFAPSIERVPTGILLIALVAVAVQVLRAFQLQRILEVHESGGHFQRWWKVVGLSVSCAVLSVILALIFSLAFYFLAADTREYGRQKNQIQFYPILVSGAEIDSIHKSLDENGLYGNAGPWYMFVDKYEYTYVISIYVTEETIQSNEHLKALEEVREQVAADFPKNKIVFTFITTNPFGASRTLE